MNYDHHSMKTLFIEYFQIDFHVQQRKKLAADYPYKVIAPFLPFSLEWEDKNNYVAVTLFSIN